MSFLDNLKRRLSPTRLEDPDFGPLRFMYISNAPQRSYWEAVVAALLRCRTVGSDPACASDDRRCLSTVESGSRAGVEAGALLRG